MSASLTTETTPLLSLEAHNWKLAISAGLVVSILAALALPASVSFWIIGLVAVAVAAAFAVNAYRRKYYGGLLVAPAIAVLFVMNIFPLLWSLGLSFFAYNSNNQSIRFVGLNNYLKVLTNDIAAPANWDALINTGMFVIFTVALQMVMGFSAGDAFCKTVSIAEIPVDPCSHAHDAFRCRVWSVLLLLLRPHFRHLELRYG